MTETNHRATTVADLRRVINDQASKDRELARTVARLQAEAAELELVVMAIHGPRRVH